jgi:hypothetical protein
MLYGMTRKEGMPRKSKCGGFGLAYLWDLVWGCS